MEPLVAHHLHDDVLLALIKLIVMYKFRFDVTIIATIRAAYSTNNFLKHIHVTRRHFRAPFGSDIVISQIYHGVHENPAFVRRPNFQVHHLECHVYSLERFV